MTNPRAGSRPEPLKIAVLGGGITGLALARRLQDRIRPEWATVTLLEASDRLGGMVTTYHDDGFTLEGGPDSFLNRKPEARRLVDDLGLGPDLVDTPAPHRRSFIYFGGQLVAPPRGLVLGVPTDIESLFGSRLLSRAGKVRALRDLVLPRRLRDGQDVSVGDFLTYRLGREVVTHLAEPILSGVYAGSADELSLDATAPQLREAERRRRSLIQGLAPQARSHTGPSRGAALPPAPPGPPPTLPSLFSTLGSGLDGLIRALEKTLRAGGTEIRTGPRGHVTALSRHEPRPGAPRYRLTLATGETLAADAVCLAVPAPAAAVLLEDIAPRASEELGAIRYVDVALVGLGYRSGDLDLPPGSGFVVPRDQDLPVTATTWVSQKWPGTAPDGSVLVRVYLGRSGEAPVLTHSDEGLLALARSSVRRTALERGAPGYRRIIRIPRALPQYAVGHLGRLARAEAELASLPGLVATGAAFRGVGLPDCIRQAEESADRLLSGLLSSD